MRDYGKVYSRFWDSEDMRSLSDDGRMLALYLMTCKHCTLAGIFRLPDGYVCEDMQWSLERVQKGFLELLRKGFATRCETTKWVWITKHLEWNEPENPNQAKAAVKFLLQVPGNCCWLSDYETVLKEFISTRRERLGNPFATLPQPVTVSVSVSVSESVSVSGTETVGFAPSGDPPEGCVPRGEGDTEPEPEPEPEPEAEAEAEAEAEQTKPTRPATGQEPAAFAKLRALYPERAGDHRWADALGHYQANIQAGISAEQMLDGVMRYARYCQREGLIGSKYVQSAAQFLGPNRAFMDPWRASSKPKRETPGERWLRNSQEREAKDAAR